MRHAVAIVPKSKHGLRLLLVLVNKMEQKRALCLTFACFMFYLTIQFQTQQIFLIMYLQHLHRQRGLLLLQASTLRARMRRRSRRKLRRIGPAQWILPRPRQSWFDIHFTDRDIPGDFFRRQFKMDRETFGALLRILSARLTRQDTSFRNSTPPEKVLALGIIRLAQGIPYVRIAHLMNVGKTTVIEAFQDVVEVLYELRNDYIQLPATSTEMFASMQTFREFTSLPNMVGALGSSRVRILAPTADNPGRFFGPSRQHEFIILAVTDGTGRFLHFSAGYPGGVSNLEALRSSTLFQNTQDVFKTPVLQMGEERVGPYLAGGREFPLISWLQTPFPGASVDPAKGLFNREISAATGRVRFALRLLKSRWGILRKRLDSVGFASKIAIASAVLHNFCLGVGDHWSERQEEPDCVGEEESCEVLGGGEHVREVLKCCVHSWTSEKGLVKEEPSPY